MCRHTAVLNKRALRRHPQFSILHSQISIYRSFLNKNPQTKENIPAGLLSLAMAFVPTQEFDTPYDPVLAFSRGTISALDKPFLRKEAVPQ